MDIFSFSDKVRVAEAAGGGGVYGEASESSWQKQSRAWSAVARETGAARALSACRREPRLQRWGERELLDIPLTQQAPIGCGGRLTWVMAS
jgi:hypothetical protein